MEHFATVGQEVKPLSDSYTKLIDRLEDMWLTKFAVKNYRSIIDSGLVRIDRMQAFVGENNAGKSNLLRALECFLSPRAGGLSRSDFRDPTKPIVIEAQFAGITTGERARLRSYLIGGELHLRKELTIGLDPRTKKETIDTEYHGYKAEPVDWHFSLKKIEDTQGARPNYTKIAADAGILESAKNTEGKVTKASFVAALEKYLLENEVPYEAPVLGTTQALGIQQNLLSTLPDFYLLPANADYVDEIDRRSSTTVFRRLMSDLSERVIKSDPRFDEIRVTLSKLRELLNPTGGGNALARIPTLATAEAEIYAALSRLMPAVQRIQLDIDVEEPGDLISRGGFTAD